MDRTAPTPAPGARLVTRRVGGAAARMPGHDGRVVVDVAAGTFAAGTDLALETLDPPERHVVGRAVQRPVRRVRVAATLPDGRAHPAPFAKKVRVTLSYTWLDVKGSAGDQLRAFWRATERDQWTPVAARVDRKQRTVTVELDHFSELMYTAEDNQAVLPTVEGFQTDLFAGDATVAIPLQVPPGTNGLTPELVLRYSSGGPQDAVSEDHGTYERLQGSWVGLGWTLDLGYIEPGGVGYLLVLNGKRYQVVAVYDGDGGGGNHVVAPDGGLVYRTQEESFLQVRQYNGPDPGGDPSVNYSYFLVRAKDGKEYRFGHESTNWNQQGYNGADYYHADGSRVDYGWLDVGDTGQAFTEARRYNLDRVTDPFGNAIDIVYTADAATRYWSGDHGSGWVRSDEAVYPAEIHYCSTDGGGGPETHNSPGASPGFHRKIIFNTSTRTDHPIGVPDGVQETKKLDSIQTQTLRPDGVWLPTTEYRFTYDQNVYTSGGEPGGQHLVLRSVTQYDANGNALPTTAFDYYGLWGWSTG